MQNPDIVLALKPVIQAFDRLSIPYYIGGSIASSVYGLARATMDVDVVVDLAPAQVASLAGLLREEYYLDEQMIQDAISHSSSFNLIHLETMMKVDVFVPKQDPYHQAANARKRQDRLVEEDPDSVFYVSSPEDIILSKLRWYEMGGRISERQWLDILGVVKVQGDSLDRSYLITWSQVAGVSDLLVRAFAEAGVLL
ncbi:MAG: hypothetical protein FJ280_30480 [Planctomycetes bacterium]|nr:hypothetical protein [Planctomycetota bacterium]